jgi:hypothetical protein
MQTRTIATNKQTSTALYTFTRDNVISHNRQVTNINEYLAHQGSQGCCHLIVMVVVVVVMMMVETHVRLL